MVDGVSADGCEASRHKDSFTFGKIAANSSIVVFDVTDSHFASLERDDALATMDSFYQRAYDLLASPQAREAFSLKSESDATRELYGMKPWGPVLRPSAGARVLIARRLVEAGARFVTVTYGAWDTHAFHYRGIET